MRGIGGGRRTEIVTDTPMIGTAAGGMPTAPADDGYVGGRESVLADSRGEG